MEVMSEILHHNLVIKLCGELDDHTANMTRTQIDFCIENDDFDNLIFDLKRLTFMDSTGIGVLIGRYKKLRSNHKVYVCNPNKTVDMIFTMAGLYDIMPKIERV